jgi:hypothetical protein
MKLDLDRVRENVCRATTEDLLDRATVYRQGMEVEALDLIDAELRRRGLSEADVAAHDEKRRAQALMAPEGWAMKCLQCDLPAVVEFWDWHRLWGRVPVFPRRIRLCEQHWRQHPRSAVPADN